MHDGDLVEKEVVKNFLTSWGLNSTRDVPDSLRSEMTSEFANFLRKQGFKKIKLHEVTFGD